MRPSGALLVGSVPLADTETVFRAAAARLGRHLRRVPDGETGERTNWISWQMPVLTACPDLVAVPPDPGAYVARPQFELRPGRSATDLRFGPLGYAAAAQASYQVFTRLRHEGVLPGSWRFQVCLPTPLAPIGAYLAAGHQQAAEPAYEAAMRREVDQILAGIPHGDLAVQWDTAVEFGMLEGVFPTWFDDVEAGIVTRLLQLGRLIPAGVSLGYHLCYGDAGHKHFVEPADTARLAAVTAGLLAGLDRPLDWLHLPVPRARDDETYFEPLRKLDLPAHTELYLGLVHFSDRPHGTTRRAAAAERALPFPFGVATECGMGRRPPDTIDELLQLHAATADPLPFGSTGG